MHACPFQEQVWLTREGIVARLPVVAREYIRSGHDQGT